MVSIGSVLVLVLSIGLVSCSSREPPAAPTHPASSTLTPIVSATSESPSPPIDSPTPEEERFEEFIPETHAEGDRVVLPVTFPDGSTAELTYPPALDIAGLGARPYWVGCGHDFGFYPYDPYGSVYQGEPLETYIGADGEPVSLWRGAKGRGPFDHLIFHFAEWTVELYQYRDSSLQSVRQDCAENLEGEVTEDGWPILSGPPSVLSDHIFGPPGGPELQFGGLRPRRFILLWPGPCPKGPDPDDVLIDGVHVQLHRDFASWCDDGGKMRIHLYFEPDSDFFQQVFDGLGIRSVRLAD